jgi:HEAT repeat protein
LVGIGVVAFWPGEREPEYEGKNLSEWLWIVKTNSPPRVAPSPQADAIRHIGERAVPWLLRWVRYKSPPWRWRLDPVIGPDRGIERSRNGWIAFRVLGPMAGSAVPELTRMANDSNSPFDCREALYTLRYMGDRGFQPVLDVLKNTNHPDRAEAAYILGVNDDWGTNRLQSAVPALIACLEATDEQLAGNAAIALGRIGLRPDLAVPELARKLTDPRTDVRRMAVRSLGLFRKDSVAVVPLLVERLSDTNTDVRDAATNALQKIAPEVLTNGVAHF